jgi:hypothetical protein
VKEIMELGNEYEIFKKWGKTITFGENKYDLDQFSELLLHNEEFYNDITEKIKTKINQSEPKIEENVED